MSALNSLLTGKVGLVVGVANEHSIAAGCAQAFRDAGAELVLTCREKSRRFVEPVAEAIKPPLLLPLDVETEGSLESVFDQIKTTFGRLDFLVTAGQVVATISSPDTEAEAARRAGACVKSEKGPGGSCGAYRATKDRSRFCQNGL